MSVSASITPRQDDILSPEDEEAIDTFFGEGKTSGAPFTILLCVSIILMGLATITLIAVIPEQLANDHDSPNLRGSEDTMNNVTANITGESLPQDVA